MLHASFGKLMRLQDHHTVEVLIIVSPDCVVVIV